jgi:hypothetical protein
MHACMHACRTSMRMSPRTKGKGGLMSSGTISRTARTPNARTNWKDMPIPHGVLGGKGEDALQSLPLACSDMLLDVREDLPCVVFERFDSPFLGFGICFPGFQRAFISWKKVMSVSGLVELCFFLYIYKKVWGFRLLL